MKDICSASPTPSRSVSAPIPRSPDVASLFSKGDDAMPEENRRGATETVLAAKKAATSCSRPRDHRSVVPLHDRARAPRPRASDVLAEMKRRKEFPASTRRRRGEAMNEPNCIFCKIVRGEIPAKKVYGRRRGDRLTTIRPQGAGAHPARAQSAHRHALRCAPGHQPALGKMLVVAGRLAAKPARARASAPSSTTAGWGIRRCIMSTCMSFGGPEPLGPMLRGESRRKLWVLGASDTGSSCWSSAGDFRHEEAANIGPDLGGAVRVFRRTACETPARENPAEPGSARAAK